MREWIVKQTRFIVKHKKEKAILLVWNLGQKKNTLENCQFNCATIEKWN